MHHCSLSHCVLNLFICKAIVSRQRVCECGVALTLNVCVPAMMRRALPQKTCRMPQSAWSRRKAAWKARQLLAVLKQGQTPHTHPVTRVKLVSADQRRPPSLQAVGDFKSQWHHHFPLGYKWINLCSYKSLSSILELPLNSFYSIYLCMYFEMIYVYIFWNVLLLGL